MFASHVIDLNKKPFDYIQRLPDVLQAISTEYLGKHDEYHLWLSEQTTHRHPMNDPITLIIEIEHFLHPVPLDSVKIKILHIELDILNFLCNSKNIIYKV